MQCVTVIIACVLLIVRRYGNVTVVTV